MESAAWLEERNTENWVTTHLDWCKMMADRLVESCDMMGTEKVTSSAHKMIQRGIDYGIIYAFSSRGPYELTKKGKELYERLK
jgi:predicted transcriptional regulator